MGIDQVLELLGGDADVPDAALRGWISSGEDGWSSELASVMTDWRRWRGDRTVQVVALVRGAPTVVELDVGGGATAATVLWDDRAVPAELRIYVDPEHAA